MNKLRVEFFEKTFPPEEVKEWVVMPSGDIVVKLECGESLWFDSKGQHPKSQLIGIDDLYKGDENGLLSVKEELALLKKNENKGKPELMWDVEVAQQAIDKQKEQERVERIFREIEKNWTCFANRWSYENKTMAIKYNFIQDLKKQEGL